jgi:MYXO-CTERM domain-containing protein
MERCVACFALGLAVTLFAPSLASARRDGIATESCNGCHIGGQEPAVRLLASSMSPSLGQMVAITVEIDAVNGPVGGFYLKLDGAGTLAAADSGIQAFDPTSLGHSSPKAASGGVVRFAFNWTAPSTPGGVIFRAWAVSGNGDNTSRGDGVGEAQLLLAYGCTGQLYTMDLDGDGFGAIEYGQKRDCSMPAGYAARDGDCQEYAPDIHPEAAERCNRMDDDCDGKLDEGLPIGPQYRDSDGDGYGYGAESILDCSSPKGYTADAHDCDDHVATTHPNATEVCNLIDDDCDGRTDEGVRPACGVGWCRRLADSCTQSICTPGKPRPEECNALDDDCDDLVDEDAVCPAGARCSEGRCLPLTAADDDAGPESSPDAGRVSAGAGETGSSVNASEECTAGARAKESGCKPAAPSSDHDDGGCSISRAGREPNLGWAAVALAVVLASFAWRRRRPSCGGAKQARR